MKIISCTPLAIPDVKVIRFQRFLDKRGYFTESLRPSQFFGSLEFLQEFQLKQINESQSCEQVFRGLHIQSEPAMGKCIRILEGKVIDFALDLRKKSAHYKQLVSYELSNDRNRNWDEWIWIPPGFAHGVYFPEGGKIEYLCTEEYNPNGEYSVSISDPSIIWLNDDYKESIINESLQSDKDKNSLRIEEFLQHL